MERRTLGRTGIQVSELSIGTGTNGYNHSSDQVRLGTDRLVRLLKSAYDNGITFWDTADGYGSHDHVRLALNGIPREAVQITTKTGSRTPESIRSDARRFCKELGTDYIDILLLHCLMEGDWPQRYADCMAEMTRLKEEGVIRAAGCSCHDFDALKATADCDWVDVSLARINYAGKHMEASPEEVIPVLRKMRQSGKGVYGMKVLGQGALSHDPEKAIRYVLDLGVTDAITIGMVSDDEIRGTIRIMEEYGAALPKAA